jgi:hypothetical protein
VSEILVDHFMDAIADDGWEAPLIERTAALAGLSVAEVSAELGDRWRALRLAGRGYDAAALASAGDVTLGVRDRLFDALMSRYDAMLPHRAAIERLQAAARRDPGLAAFFAVQLPRAMARIADACGVRTTGLRGLATVQGLTLLHLDVTRAWIDDSSGDLSATMKALDERLAQAEGWAQRLRVASAASAAAPAPSADPPPVSVH